MRFVGSHGFGDEDELDGQGEVPSGEYSRSALEITAERICPSAFKTYAGTGQNRHSLLLSNERAREWSDDEPLGIGGCLGVVGVSEPENVAREPEDRVLEAGSGRDQGHAAFPRVADGPERALHAAARTPRRDPKTVVGGKLLLRLVSNHVRWYPFDTEPEMFDGTARQQVVSVLRIEIANDADQGGGHVSHHVSILLGQSHRAASSDRADLVLQPRRESPDPLHFTLGW